MKLFRCLPWQVQFALAAPFLVLAIFSASYGGRMYEEWQIRQRVERALDSFDPDTMAFTVSAEGSLNGVERCQKTSAQLTDQQRQLVGQWVKSFRYEKVSCGGYIGGSPCLWVEFDSPQGSVFASGVCRLQTGRKFPLPWLGYQNGTRKNLRAIAAGGLSESSRVPGSMYCAEFDSDRTLWRQLWESLTGRRWAYETSYPTDEAISA